MFFYGFYLDEQMKTHKGSVGLLKDFREGALERGMELIAFSMIDLPSLHGWRHFVVGANVEALVCECNRVWTHATGGTRGLWEMRRLDDHEFMVRDGSGRKSKEMMGSQLTFG